ncbi:MAG: pyridoxine 5'-phosphate synthase [Wenzhouxiangellaceae bacterium]
MSGLNPRAAVRLGVNIDHVATLRQVRGTDYPSVVQAALVVAEAGADLLTVHLREDRRHIQDRDVELLRELCPLPLNLEAAVTEEMLDIACATKPDWCCLVPEKRSELTTEGGLDVVAQQTAVAVAVQRLQQAGIKVSLFIDAETAQLEAAGDCGADAIELHTGAYAEAVGSDRQEALRRLTLAMERAEDLGLGVHAGHGLHYHNVQAIAALPQLRELNIGHAIVARSLFTGLAAAVREMQQQIRQARVATF